MAEARSETAQRQSQDQPEDQPEEKERQGMAPGRLPHVIAIASGKGGVGKSSVTVNLGISLAKLGQRVCIFDADTGLANINILLGLTPRVSLEHVLFGAKAIEEVMLESAHGMKVIPGANGISECVSLHPRQQLRLTRELARIEGEFDYFLIDTAAGIADTTLDFICSAQTVLVVITPEPTSLTDAFSLLKLLHRRRRQLSAQVLVNMCGSTAQAREVYHRFAAAVEKYIGLRTRYLGFLMRDESLRAAVSLQSPVALFPDTDPSSRSFLRLAEALEQSLRDEPARSGFSAYWLRRFRERQVPAQPPVAAAVAGSSADAAYLGELKSRLQLLLERDDGQQRVGRLLRELHNSYLQRYQQPAIDLLPLVEALARTPERNDRLLRQLAERLKPWRRDVVAEAQPSLLETQSLLLQPQSSLPQAQPASKEAPTPVIEVQRIALAPPGSALTETRSASSPLPGASGAIGAAHGFDERRFGSQQTLLDLLQRKGEARTVLELIDLL